MDIIKRLDKLINEDAEDNKTKKYVSSQRKKHIEGLKKALEYERKRQKTLKTPEEKEKGRKRIKKILDDIETVRQGAREDREKNKK